MVVFDRYGDGQEWPDVQRLLHWCVPRAVKVADSGNIVIQKQCFAKFGTRVQAYTMPLVFEPRKNQKTILGGLK